MNIGEKIRLLRTSKMMTQAELAGDQITRNMLSRIENGGALPSVPTLIYVASKLGVPAGYLLSEDSEEFYYRKQNQMPDIMKAYSAGDWEICRDLCSKLGEVDDEIGLIECLCCYGAAREAFSEGKLRDACELFDAVFKRSSSTVYPTERIKSESNAYLLYMRNISPSLDWESETEDEIPIQSLADPFCRYFAVIESVSAENAPGFAIDPDIYIDEASGNEKQYAGHVRAKLLMKEKNFSEAYHLLKKILSGNDEIPAPMLYYIFSDLEICCRELLDYKGAYEYSGDKMGMVERFLR